MRRRSFMLALGALAAAPAGKAFAQSSGAGAMVIRGLAEAPASGADGSAYAGYVVLIPTHEETQATAELRQAIATASSKVASRLEGQFGSLFVGDPETGAFSAAASSQAITELNARYNFGLDPSGGAILLLVRGPLSSAAAADVFSRTYSTNDPAVIATSLREASWGSTGTKGPPNTDLFSALGGLIPWPPHFSIPGTTPHPPRPSGT